MQAWMLAWLRWPLPRELLGWPASPSGSGKPHPPLWVSVTYCLE